jgi:hypothetical protein
VSTQPDSEEREPVALSARERVYLLGCLAILWGASTANDIAGATSLAVRRALEAALRDHGVTALSKVEADGLARLLRGRLDG